MNQTRRLSLLQGVALALLGRRLWSKNSDAGKSIQPILVKAGADHDGTSHTVGVSATTFKVLTAETAGAMFVMEQANAKKGGPSRHYHFDQDELFYVLEGEYVVEVGSERFNLSAGDCVLGPRRIPHAWAFVGETKGRLLLSYSPAGRMEEFFSHREQLGIGKGSYASTKDAEVMRA
jgi:mannose-6-phosphate isomerase-like protein (cupin superfamily)